MGGFFLARCKFLPVGPGVSFFKWAGFSPEPAGYRYEHRIKGVEGGIGTYLITLSHYRIGRKKTKKAM